MYILRSVVINRKWRRYELESSDNSRMMGMIFNLMDYHLQDLPISNQKMKFSLSLVEEKNI
jgi:hypothetical protein